MSAANPNTMEKSMVSVLVVANAGGGLLLLCGVCGPSLLTGGSLVTDGRVTQNFRKEKVRSNNSNDGNYLLLWEFSRS
jgi:hypothetical protein